MKGRILTQKIITQFKIYLQNEEKSENTYNKYIRDAQNVVQNFQTVQNSAWNVAKNDKLGE